MKKVNLILFVSIWCNILLAQNAVYMNTMAIGHDTLNSAQYNTLNAVAVQCPLMGGMAVYKARVMLNWMLDTVIEYMDNCGSASLEEMKPIKTQTSNLNTSVYPNPANTALTIAIPLQLEEKAYFEFFDATGTKVEEIQLKANETVLPLTKLADGIYFYRITDTEGNLIKENKIIVLH